MKTFVQHYISKLDSDPIEKKLWHFEVRVITGGEKRNNFSRQIRHHLLVVFNVREVLREEKFLSIFFVHYLGKCKVFIQRIQIHFCSHKDKKFEIIY